MRVRTTTIRFLFAWAFLTCLPAAHAQNSPVAARPNIVLVFLDNFGWGEPGFNGGGIVRGAPTPRLDELAAEGLRLTNFNVEAQGMDWSSRTRPSIWKMPSSWVV